MTSDRHLEVDAEALLDLRWQVLRVGRPRHTASLPGDDAPGSRHFATVRDGVVVACATVMATPWPDQADPLPAPVPALRLRGMAVTPGLQGQGVGAALLRHVHAQLDQPLWCDARLAAVPFYERAGWTVCSALYEVVNVGPHKRMVWRPVTS